MFIILKTYTESLSYISTSFSPLGPGPCLLVAYRVRVSLDNRNERKWTTKQIRIRDKKWNGDALEKCFFLLIWVWLAQQTVSKGTEMCIDKMRCHFNDVLLAFYWQVYVYYLSMHSLSLIFYSLSLLCLKFRERTSFFLFHILFRFLFVCWFVLWPFYTAHRSIRCGFSFIFQFKCVPMHLWALFIV